MSKSENKRRKKLEARRRRSKEKQRAVARQKSTGMAASITTGQNWPVIAAQISEDENGIRTALLARKGADGKVAAGVFMVDTDCLGVKNAIPYFGSLTGFSELRTRLHENTSMMDVTPEYVCKFVRESVAYARSFELKPHSDYVKASPIFGDIDPNDCLTEFEFGRDGMPFFVAGPYDNADRRKRILETLTRTAGKGNFRFVLPVRGDDAFDSFSGPDDDQSERQRLSGISYSE